MTEPVGPALPDGIADIRSAGSQAFLDEMNRMPLFMKTLDATDGEGGQNQQLEALEALSYEGEPIEVAENFRQQGNARYQQKVYRDAIEFYTRALAVKAGDDKFDEALYSNRAACNLILRKLAVLN